MDMKVAAGERAAFSGPVARFFEGVEGFSVGTGALPDRLEHADLGHGAMWCIHADAHALRRQQAGSDRTAQTFSVLMVLEGTAEVRQRGRHCSLGANDFTLVDGAQPFEVDVPTAIRKVLLTLPRQAVLARHLGIETRTALAHDTTRPGNRLFRDFVDSVSRSAHAVSFAERCTLLSASIEMLGLVEAQDTVHQRLSRLERAIAEIEMNLSDPELSAQWVARRLGLSRRHADSLFERTGLSVNAQIWERRLQRAAQSLISPLHADHKMIEIALACGFRDPGHFSRAFRKRFGLTPSQWRQHRGPGAESDDLAPASAWHPRSTLASA